MNFIQMVITILFILVVFHVIRWTLETHTHIASCAVDLVATVYFYHRHLACRIWTEPTSMFFHVFFEKLVRLTDLQYIFAPDALMGSLLNKGVCTLHKLQYSILHV